MTWLFFVGRILITSKEVLLERWPKGWLKWVVRDGWITVAVAVGLYGCCWAAPCLENMGFALLCLGYATPFKNAFFL